MKNKIIQKIEEKLAKSSKNKIYNLLLDDYLFYFVYKNFKELNLETMINIKPFLRIILDNVDNKSTLNENNIDIGKISPLFNWVETYSMEIIPIIQMYLFLNSFKKEEQLNKRIKEEIANLNNEYKELNISENIKIINRIFYITIGSLIKILISELSQILSGINNKENLDELLDKMNNIYYSLLTINNSLNLTSKEIHIFHETINIISKLSFKVGEEEIKKNKKLMIDFIQKKVIQEKTEEKGKKEGAKLKNKNDNNDNGEKVEDTEEEKNLKKHLENLNDYYKQKSGKNFADVFSSILFDEFNKENNEKYRQYILKTILDDDNLIQYNTLLIKIILYEYIKPTEEYINAALDCISNEEIFFPSLNDCNKDAVNKLIMKVFDSIINLYFDSLYDLKKRIITDIYDIFKDYLRKITDEEYEYYYNNYCNETLVKIYILCFIRIYLNRFAKIFCEERTELEGNEGKIIDEINKDSPIANTLRIYFMILIYNKTKSLDILRTNGALETISNKLKEEIDNNKFNDILIKASIPKEDKYLFKEYFAYIKYPSLENFLAKFISFEDNKEKYPLINEYIKTDSGIENLKYLKDYNDFVNLMINYYSGNIQRNEANKAERSLNGEDIYNKNINNFEQKLDKFKKIWNEHLSKHIKDLLVNKKLNSQNFVSDIKGNERLAFFLNDDDENGYGIYIKYGYDKFIQWQNSFLAPIIRSYKSKKNNLLSCYISQMEKSVNIQNANNFQIVQVEKCFDKSYFVNFEELLSFYCQRDINDINDFIYNFGKIEEELGKSLLPGKCLFNEKNINYVCYQNEGFRNINLDYLIKFAAKYGEKDLTEEEQKNIFNYASKEFNNFGILCDSFILLINYLNNNFATKNDIKIFDLINQAKNKYINFNNQFINYFNNEGKEIVIEKLLTWFLFMEHICYEHLVKNIDIKFQSTLDKGQKEKIKAYFNLEHKDQVITKKEIASAVRRFITRYLLNDNIKQNIDANLSLYKCLERKYLWKNKIFAKIGNEFNDLIKKYLGGFQFTLQVRHAKEFYDLIGEEEKAFIKEVKDKFAGKEKETEGNIKKKEEKKPEPGKGLGGKPGPKTGAKMKNKKNNLPPGGSGK